MRYNYVWVLTETNYHNFLATTHVVGIFSTRMTMAKYRRDNKLKNTPFTKYTEQKMDVDPKE